MLTDIFAYRYKDIPLWNTFDESARRLLVQGFRIVREQLFPYCDSDGKERIGLKEKWDGLNRQLAMELGLEDLSPVTWGYYNPQKRWISGVYPKVDVCGNFVCSKFEGTQSADVFVKERLSFIEIAFRLRSEEIAKANAELPKQISDAKLRQARATRGHRVAGGYADARQAANEAVNTAFRSACIELNERFRQAGTNLDYHNGLIQLSTDDTTLKNVDRPFWQLVSDPKWQNVDMDMKEAIDLRDSGGRDPAFYAAKALESVIKIISDEKNWSTGREKGACNYLDNLLSKKNGKFIHGWEHEVLTKFFTNVRNPFGHGAGSEEMPELSAQQTDWAIEFCMIWTKNLVRRM